MENDKKLSMDKKIKNKKIAKVAIIILVIILAVLIVRTLDTKKGSVVLDDASGLSGEVDSVIDEGMVEEKEVYEEGVTEEGIALVPQDESIREKFNEFMVEGGYAFTERDYVGAESAYKKALNLIDSDVVYARLFAVYGASLEDEKALEAINTAIIKNPTFTDYYNSKIEFLRDRFDVDYEDLKVVYNEGVQNSNPETKVNLVLYFARISEELGEKEESVELWKEAIELYPENTEIYQAEIDRINS